MTPSPGSFLRNPPGLPFARPPFFGRPEPDQAFRTDRIILSVQIGDVDVQGAVQPGSAQELLNGSQRGAERVGGRPVFARQQGETDLAGREMYIGMAYGGDEVDFWRGKRVV